MVLELDLNYPPPDENILQMSNLGSVNTNLELALYHVQSTTAIDQVDDDVVICSPRSFAEARDKSRRNREVVVVLDEEPESQRCRLDGLSPGGNRPRSALTKRRNGSGNLCIHSEGHKKARSENAAIPVAQPQAPSFKCPICLGHFVEETSTKCGHIFCKKCINAAIAAQQKCPSCRRKLKVKDIFRIYLPAVTK